MLWRRGTTVLSAAMLVGVAVNASVAPMPSSEISQPVTRLVVTVSGPTSLSLPGVALLADLPAVHAAVVSATPAGRAALLRDQRVLGVAADARAVVAGKDVAGKDSGVLASGAVGDPAGLPTAGRGVTVALLDTGVSDTFALDRKSGRLIDAVDTSGLSRENGTIKEKGQFTDAYGHGTFMASVIAGGPSPGNGTRGVGVAPAARIAVVKVADDQGATSLASVLAGLNWVATHSDTVSIANLSLSVEPPSERYGIDPLTYAIELTRAQGVTVVVAAGNVAGHVSDPGFAPAAVTVGAADTTGNVATVAAFSGSASVAGMAKPDLVAPGMQILGMTSAGSQIARDNPHARQPGGLFRGSGTSQAAAVVSGVAAIVKQQHPDATPLQVKSALRDAARHVNSSSALSAGTGLVAVPFRLSETNTGESTLDIEQWLATHDEWGAAWDSDLWSARSWSARSWSARSWSSDAWSARSWSARSWSARSWSARSWSARSWSTHAWGDLQ
jgi:serine protease AprX